MNENNTQSENTSNTPDPSVEPTSAQASPQKNTLMAVLSYIGPLVIVSYLTTKDDPFVKFHIKQGAVLFVIEVAIWFIGMAIWMLWPVLQLVNLAVVVLAIIGIINAVNGVEKTLPFVGKFASHFNI